MLRTRPSLPGRLPTLFVASIMLGSAAAAQAPDRSAPPRGPDLTVSATIILPTPKPKPTGPTPARSLTINNATGAVLTGFEVTTADGQSAKLAKEVGSEEMATLPLPRFRQCAVSIVATFDGDQEPESFQQDICKIRAVRLVR